MRKDATNRITTLRSLVGSDEDLGALLAGRADFVTLRSLVGSDEDLDTQDLTLALALLLRSLVGSDEDRRARGLPHAPRAVVAIPRRER